MWDAGAVSRQSVHEHHHCYSLAVLGWLVSSPVGWPVFSDHAVPGIVFDTAEKEHPATIKCIVVPCNCYGVLCCESRL